MLRRLVALTGIGALAAVTAAAPQNFSPRLQQIRAGVVILEASKVGSSIPRSPAPFAFYNLDRATNIKPAAWSFVNPFGPTVATARTQLLWGVTPGTKLSKSTAPYWEVRLSELSDTSLSQYDVLLVNPQSNVQLNTAEREKLRRFVDKGGLLWIDTGALAGASYDASNNFPIPFKLESTGATTFGAADYTNTLLTKPNYLTPFELQLMNGGGTLGVREVTAADSPLPLLLGGDPSNSYQLQPVQFAASSGGAQTIGIGRIGDGLVVVTARGASIALNNAGNSAFQAAEPRLSIAGTAAARFAVNMISQLDSYRTVGGGGRKNGSNTINVTAPLLGRFTVADANASPDANQSQPAIYDGMVFVTAGARLLCYDANPLRDLDGDGNPDDGAIDFSRANSNGQDLLWTANLGVQISSPVIAEVPQVRRISGNPLPRKQVLVSTSLGRLIVVSAMRPNKGEATRAAIRTIDPPSAVTGGDFPPVVSEGLAYMTGSAPSGGAIWIADLATGQPLTTAVGPFVAGGAGLELPNFNNTPTVAYIPTADNSGGLDKVLYVPFSSSPGASAPGFVSLWVGAKGEQPTSFEIDEENDQLRVQTRAMTSGGLPIYHQTTASIDSLGGLTPKLTVFKSNGDVFTANELNAYFSGTVDDVSDNGELTYGLKSGAGATLKNAMSGLRVDYTIDWSRAASSGTADPIRRGILSLPVTNNNSNPERQILGNIAVTPNGTIFVVVGTELRDIGQLSNNKDSGSVFAFREDAGRGAFRCVMRYDLFPTYQFTPNQGSQLTYRSNFRDSDLVRNFSPFLGGDYVENPRTVSGPSVRGDKVFVMAEGAKGFVRMGILLAFAAEPEMPEIKVGDIGEAFSLIQPDILRSDSTTQPLTQTILTNGNVRYDRENGVIRFENLMTLNRGPITSCISLSQPVLLRRIGQPDQLIEPELAGGRWSPLLWYHVMHGLLPTTQPSVSGNTLYMAGSSLLPYIFTNNAIPPNPGDKQYWSALNYALNVDLGQSDPNLVPDPNRGWNRQLVQLRSKLNTDGSTTPTGNDNIVWPQFSGLSGTGAELLANYQQRLNQTKIAASNLAYGVIAAQDAAAAWGDGGLSVYNRADIVVVDQGRIGRYDASGNALWTTDATVDSGPQGDSPSARPRTLVSPTRAYPISESETLIVDPGSNRVAIMNGSGVETRTLESFIVDQGFVPAGFLPNSPTTLSGPRDAITWSGFVDRGTSAIVTGQGNREFWVHYLIADTGNRRLLEIIDRYNVDADNNIQSPVLVGGTPQLGVLLWQTPATLSGKGFAYSSLARMYVPDSATSGHFAYLAGISDAAPVKKADMADNQFTTTDAFGRGGLVLLDPQNPAATKVYQEYGVPDLATTRFWDEKAGIWSTQTKLSKLGTRRPIGSVRSISVRPNAYDPGTNKSTYSVTIADSTGVYVSQFDPAATRTVGSTVVPDTTFGVTWFLPNEAYRVMRRTLPSAVPAATNPDQLNATYATQLDNGEILVVNGYYGTTRGTKINATTTTRRGQIPFAGEVLQLNPTTFNVSDINLGFLGKNSISYELRSLSNTRPITLPTFADRR